MTQQYVLGKFSVLLADLDATASEWQSALRRLRRHVEASSMARLPALAEDVLHLTDAMCWTALQQGELTRFCSCAKSAAELNDFLECAGLLPH